VRSENTKKCPENIGQKENVRRSEDKTETSEEQKRQIPCDGSEKGNLNLKQDEWNTRDDDDSTTNL
jgi:hypothetical protein